MRAGEILFDLPSAQVTEPMLAELYEAEKGQIPKQIES
jgi:ABC-type phosphate/phosphonate transport system ATPase subunit